MKQKVAKDIDEYIAGFDPDIQKILQQVRGVIKKTAPKATEAIKYGMPAFILNEKNLVYFAAFKKHIGFYPVPTGKQAFPELKDYKTGKGSVQFPLDKPMPVALITKTVKFRMQQFAAGK